MRKSTRVFALILMLALLIGATVTAVFAAEVEVTSVSPDIDVSDNGLYDAGVIKRESKASTYEGTSFSAHWKSGSKGSCPVISAAVTTGSGKNHGHFESRVKYGNTYAVFWYDCKETNENGEFIAYTTENRHDAFLSFYSVGAGTDNCQTQEMTANSLDYDSVYITNDYMVWDFDISSDKYLVGTALKDTLAEGEVGKLAYPNLTINLMTRKNGSNSDVGYGVSKYYRIYSDANGFYFTNDIDTTKRIYLSNEIGVWNHITLIAEIDNRIDITIVPKNAEEGTEGTPFTDIKFMDAVAKAQTDFGYTAAEAKVYVVNNAKNYHLFDSQLHAFVNGKYLVSYKFLAEQKNMASNGSHKDGKYYVSPAHLRCYEIRMGDGSTESNRDSISYSVSFDNVTTHYYKSGYSTTTTADNTLGQYISEDTYNSFNLAYCNDVVYNANYLVPNPNTPVASTTLGETVTPNYTGYFTDVAKDATVTVVGENAIYIDSVKGEINVVAEDLAKVTLSEAVAKDYVFLPVNYDTNTYKLTLRSTVTFKDVGYTVYSGAYANGFELGTALSNGTVILGDFAAIKDSVPATLEKNPDKKDGIFMEFDSWWMTYKLSNGETYVGPARVIGEEIVNNNPDGIVYFPYYNEVQYAFSVIDTATGYVVPGVDYTVAMDNFGSVVNTATAPAGTYIVTIYTDITVKISGGAYGITANSNRTIYFDFNGNDYVYANDKYNNKGGSFSVGKNGELHLYSSKPGGRVFNFSYNKKSSANGGPLVNMGGADTVESTAKIYFGKVDTVINGIVIKADGNNLWTSSALLIESGNSTNYFSGLYETDSEGAIVDRNGDEKITILDMLDTAPKYYNEIHIDGGIYTRPNADGGGLVKTNAYLQVDAKNALFIANNVFATDGRYNSRITGTVDNCVLYTHSNSSLFGQFHEGSELYFTNTTFAGALAFAGCTYSSWTGTNAKYCITSSHPLYKMSQQGIVYLGEGCKTTGATPTMNNDGLPGVRAAAGVEVVDINETYQENHVWYFPSYTYDTDAQGILNPESVNTPINIIKQYALTKGYTAKDDTVTFNWIYRGNNIESTTIPVIGPKLYLYGFKPKTNTTVDVDETKFFKIGVSYWTLNGEALASNINSSTGTLDLVSVIGAVAPDNSNFPMLQNFDFRTKFTGNAYVPKFGESSVVIDGVTYIISASTAKKGSTVISSSTSFGGKTYDFNSYAYPSAIDIESSAGTFSLSYTVTKVVDPNNRDLDIVESIVLTYYPYSFANYLKEAFIRASTDVEKKLVANVMQYCFESYKYAGKTGPSIKAWAESNADYLRLVTNIDSAEFNAKVAGTAAKTGALPAGIENYVESVKFHNFGGVPTFAVVPVKNVVNGDTMNMTSTVRLDYKSWSQGTTRYLSLAVAPSSDTKNWKDYKDAFGNNISGQRNSSNLGYYMDINGHFFAYDINNIYTIIITTVDASGEKPVEGEVYSFEYCLADYILELEAKNDGIARVMKALAAYGESAVEYFRDPTQSTK